MSKTRYRLIAALFIAAALLPGRSFAVAINLTLLEHLNNHTMLEAMANGVQIINEGRGGGIADPKTFSWTGSYSDAGWSATISGQLGSSTLALAYTGTTVLNGSGIATSTSITGSGNLGSEPISISALVNWGHDGTLYQTLAYEELGQLGSNTLKWWVKALEALGGAAIGSVGGIGAGTVAGAVAGISLSEKFAKKEENTGAFTPPEPADPSLPVPSDWLAVLDGPVGANMLRTAVYADGSLTANSEDLVTIDGFWSGGTASGSISAVSAVPIPAAIWLFASGFLALLTHARVRTQQ